METMKAYVIQKDDKYFVGGNMFEWTYDLQNAHRFLKKETAVDAIQKNGCLENANIIDCVIEYEDDYTFIKKDDGSTRPLTPEILAAAGYVKDGNDSFEVVDDINDDYKNYRRISLKISDGDCQLKTILRKYANSNEYLVGIEGKFKQKEIKIPSFRQITVGEFNTLLDIVKLEKFKIK